jgi:hypothetical protein
VPSWKPTTEKVVVVSYGGWFFRVIRNAIWGLLVLASSLLPQARVQALEELHWADSGLYLSRRTLGDDERQRLRAALTQAARSGRVWRLFNDHYPQGSLAGSIRPLP